MNEADELNFSTEALATRSVFYTDLNDINIFVEDTDSEYMYETIFKRMLGDEYRITAIFPCGGKAKVIERFHEVGVGTADKRNIYIVDGDFDMIVHRENMILDTPEFIYLKSYNIENYLIDEKAILGFAKGKLKQVDEFVARKIDFQGWKQRIIREASKLFLCYCFIQKQKIDEKNVSRSPYEFIDKKTGFERTDEAYMQYYKHIKNISNGKIDEGIREIDSIVREIYNGDYFNIICGKFLLASLGCYLRAKIKERIDNDTLQWELILNFDINKLDFIKAVILQTPPSRAV